jgi:uncharacterized phosphosugar-binding protein
MISMCRVVHFALQSRAIATPSLLSMTCHGARQSRQAASHSSGKRLADAADVLIDTGAPVEDAIVPIKG